MTSWFEGSGRLLGTSFPTEISQKAMDRKEREAENDSAPSPSPEYEQSCPSPNFTRPQLRQTCARSQGARTFRILRQTGSDRKRRDPEASALFAPA